MSIKGLVFDLDGVLADTTEPHYQSWKRLTAELGVPFTRQDNEALRGLPRRASLMLILKERQFSEEQMLDMMERKNRYFFELIREMSPRDLLPGVRELLEEIRAAGLKSAVGSASRNAPEIARRLGVYDLFDVILHGGSVKQQKPAPDIFLRVAAELNLNPAECLVLEDGAAGIEAAREGGFRSVGLGPPERVGEADLVLPSLKGVHLTDLLAALQK